MALPILAITLGDVCGIGPEICLKALSQKEIYKWCVPVVIGDKAALSKAASVLKQPVSFIDPPWESNLSPEPGRISLIEVSHFKEDEITFGQPTPAVGKAAYEFIKKAVGLTLKGKTQGIVTCPVNKAVINQAGIPFTGHTELLAQLTNTKRYAMMLAGSKLKVVLATIHVALKDVPQLITCEGLLDLIDLTTSFFEKYLGKRPKIAVAGLNPHAGEKGLMGKEEEEIIEPAVNLAQKRGYFVFGPFPPDTIFYWAAAGHYDVVLCMYHDQGLIPLKLLHFWDAVNVTMGLPIVRTSVDHGTAYDIAGKGLAKESSLIAAMKMASEMVQNSD